MGTDPEITDHGEHPEGRSASPPFVTGGGGFEYEDRVAAFVLAAILAGQPPFGEDVGLVRRVDWQTSDIGWEFDDLLLTRVGANDPKLAISCKAGTHVTGGGWPADAAAQIWKQWTRSAQNPFRRGVDLLGVVTGSLALGVDEAWDRVVHEAVPTDPARIAIRFSGPGASNQMARELVESLKRPDAVAGEAANEPVERAELIRSVRLWRRDLLRLDSADTTRAVEWCRQALASGDREIALDLLESLHSVATDRRIRGGTIELRDLVTELGQRYSFRCWPQDEAPWEQLAVHSADLMGGVRESLGDRICLAQSGAMGELEEAAIPGHVVFIEGESGTGKSALAKRLSRSQDRVLWFSAADLEAETLGGVAASLGVQAPLDDLIDRDRVRRALLVVDGAERLSARGLRHAARLAAAAVRAARPWLVVVTTQREGTDRMLVDLQRQGLDPEACRSVPIALPGEEMISTLMPALPLKLAGSPSRALLRALRNLKVLDLTIHSVTQKTLRGFPDLVEQVWAGFLGQEDKAARAGVLKILARADANVLTGGAPSHELRGAEDERVAERLAANGLLLFRRERYFFRHDLIGDWGRLLHLVESAEDVDKILDEVAPNIRWAPAIRLYAEWSLGTGDAQRQRIVDLVSEERPHPALDPLIEGLCRSPDSAPVLDQVLARLGTTRVSVVARILRTFLAVATEPSALSLALRRDHPMGAMARAMYRVPMPELWPGVVEALDKRSADLAPLLPLHLGEVARVWLLDETTANKGEYARTSLACASLAVAAARELQARLAVTRGSDKEDDERVFEALLLAAPWLPDEVAQVALELSHRLPTPPAVVERVEAERKRVEDAIAQRLTQMSETERAASARRTFSIGPLPRKKRDPFAEGPSEQVEDSFRNAVFKPGAVVRLMLQRPKIAQEVLLACCLEDPTQDDPLYADFPHDDHTGTVSKLDWFPPLYLRGPWLGLLLRSPEHGLEAVIRLISVATQEWLRLLIPPPGSKRHDWMTKWSTIVLDVDGELRTFRGGAEVFGWYRGHGRPGNIVASALMALEHWLYRCMDAGQSIDRAVQRILESGDSVALLGVLAALARRHQDLLRGPLLPLVSSWMLLDRDEALTAQSRMPEIDPFGLKALNTWLDDEADKWSNLPHRGLSLPWKIAAKLTFGEQGIVTACEKARARWQAEVADGTCIAPETVERLRALLNPQNLTVTKHEAGHVIIEVTWPPDFAARFGEGEKESERGIAAFHIRKRMRETLDRRQALTDSQAEALWNATSSLRDQPSTADETEATSPASARAAVAAVLEMLAGDWLDRFPERRAWCESAARSVGERSTRDDGLPSGVSMFKEHAEAFAGTWAVARLAAGDSRPEVRRILAEAVMADEPIVTGQVLTAAVSAAKRLPDELGRLFNLLWLWAALCNLSPGWPGEENEKAIAEARRRRLVSAFVGARIPNTPIPWEQLRLRAARVRERHDRRRRARAPSWYVQDDAGSQGVAALPDNWAEYDNHGFNWSVLERVILPLPVVVRPSRGSSLSTLIELDRRLLDLVTFTMSRARRDGTGEDRLPNLFDHYALGRLALLIASHEDDAFAAETWKRVAILLANHPKWCEAFFDDWFRQPRTEPEQAQGFHRRWRAMVETALQLPEWEPDAEQWSYDRAKTWSALLGVHERGSNLGIDADRPYLETIRDVYAKWARRALTDRWRLRTFCGFLQKPGATDLRVPALPWIRKALEGLSAYLGRERELVREVAAVCVVAWHSHREEILGTATSRESLVWIIRLLSRMRVEEIAEVREDLEAAVAPNDTDR